MIVPRAATWAAPRGWPNVLLSRRAAGSPKKSRGRAGRLWELVLHGQRAPPPPSRCASALARAALLGRQHTHAGDRHLRLRADDEPRLHCAAQAIAVGTPNRIVMSWGW